MNQKPKILEVNKNLSNTESKLSRFFLQLGYLYFSILDSSTVHQDVETNYL